MESDCFVAHKRSIRWSQRSSRHLAAVDCREEDYPPEGPESRRAEFSFVDGAEHSAGKKSN